MIQQNKSLGTRLVKLLGPWGYHNWNFPSTTHFCLLPKSRVCVWGFYFISRSTSVSCDWQDKWYAQTQLLTLARALFESLLQLFHLLRNSFQARQLSLFSRRAGRRSRGCTMSAVPTPSLCALISCLLSIFFFFQIPSPVCVFPITFFLHSLISLSALSHFPNASSYLFFI